MGGTFGEKDGWKRDNETNKLDTKRRQKRQRKTKEKVARRIPSTMGAANPRTLEHLSQIAALILEHFRMSYIGCSPSSTLDHSTEALE